MDDNFKLRANLKTDAELHECIENREKYLPETVEAAVNELQNRGITFSHEELQVIGEDMLARRELAKSGSDTFNLFGNQEKNNQIEDPEAPAFYTKRAILVISVLFSVFFGSILMAINLYKTSYRDKAILVLLFGFGFSIILGVLAPGFNFNPVFSITTGFLGAYGMEYLFWNKYIGRETLYRVRPIWIPLIIILAVVIPLVVYIYYNKDFLLTLPKKK